MTDVRLPTCVAVALLCALAMVVGPTLSVASAEVSRDLPRRTMHDDVFRNDKGWLVFKGNVDPGWNNKNVQVFKRTCPSCAWALVEEGAHRRLGPLAHPDLRAPDGLLVLEGAGPPVRWVREVGDPHLPDLRAVGR